MSLPSFEASDLEPSSIGVSWSWLSSSLGNGKRFIEFSTKLNVALAQELQKFLANSLTSDRDREANGRIIEYAQFVSRVARRWYGLYGACLQGYLSEVGTLGERERRLLSFFARQHINALSPSNFFWTNPSAVKRFIDTKGVSLGISFTNWLSDLTRNDWSIQGCDLSAFKIGENIATSQGAVVYRNHLFELIQYPAEGGPAFSTPVVIVHPWINKFYIFDLDEQKSLIRFLSKQGFTTFITSWKNPTRDMRGVTFEDYVIKGALTAVEVARDICQSQTVHAVGYCLGGTTLSALMAVLNRADPQRVPVKDWSLFTTAVNFSDPGPLGILFSKKIVRLAEVIMRRDGYLDGKYVSAALNLMRSDSQIWWRYSHNYIQGRKPSFSDFMFWNHDHTRLPEAMCSFCLRELCLQNKLVQKDSLTIGGHPVDLGRISQPLYAVAGVEDHICEWGAAFSICREIRGPVRYVLSSGGHITAIVNPPAFSTNSKYWANDATESTDAEKWLKSTEAQKGSWWLDWVRWLSNKDHKKQRHTLGNQEFPAIAKAPGYYVFEK
jgi:polyhydroxyalkanoate synthase